ncbi:MAG: MarR family transcriptional regulator [Dehalococcoidia bacterium]|nr:MarR family transcriptional regulator [Dehalococcoidia bacterium]
MAETSDLVRDVQEMMAAVGAAAAEIDPSAWDDLTMAQVRALVTLNRATTRVGEFASVLRVSSNAATAILDRLEGLGLAQRQADPADRRAVLVSVTPSGRRRIEDLVSARGRVLGEALARLDTDDLLALRQGHVALLDALRRGSTGATEAPGTD